MKRVDWRELSRDPRRVEDLLAAMLIDMHPTAVHVDGSGGDGGRDVTWQGPDGLVIFEVKSFSDRLHPDQKRQIKRSLAKALTHDPAHWVLVLPLNLTPGEQSWFHEVLAADTDVPLSWMCRTAIDLELARRPHLTRGFVDTTANEAFRMLAEHNQEQAVLSDATDLRRRVEVLQGRASEVDPHYDLAFASRPGVTEISLLPRTPWSMEQRPITGSFTFTPADTDEGQEVLAAYRRCLDYGTSVRIPSKYVSAAAIDAPLGLGFEVSVDDDGNLQSTTGMTMPTIQLGPNMQDSEWAAPGRIVAFGAGDEVQAEIAIQWTGRSAGARGGVMYGSDRLGRFNFTLTHDWAESDESHLQVQSTFNFEPGLTAKEMLEALDWADAMGSATRVWFDVAGEPILGASGSVGSPDDSGSALTSLRPFIEDLACIQEVTVPFQVPDDLTGEQFWLVGFVARLIRDGAFDQAQDEVAMTIVLTNPDAFIEDAGRDIERAYAEVLTIDLGFLSPGIAVECLSHFVGRRKGSRRDLQGDVRAGSSVRLCIAVTGGVVHHHLRGVRRG